MKLAEDLEFQKKIVSTCLIPMSQYFSSTTERESDSSRTFIKGTSSVASKEDSQVEIEACLIPSKFLIMSRNAPLKIKEYSPLRLQIKREDSEESSLQWNESVIKPEKSVIKNPSLEPIEEEDSYKTTTYLSSLLNNLLNRKAIVLADLDSLNFHESVLVKSLAKKLYSIDIPLEATPLDTLDLINKNLSKPRSKRLEEELKLVFKKTMKHLLTKIKEKLHSSAAVKKEVLVREFYMNYFADAYRSDAELQKHFEGLEYPDGYPNYQRINSNIVHPLTVNLQYIKLITRSERIKLDITHYLDSLFVSEYEVSFKDKVRRIVRNFNELLERKALDHSVADEQQIEQIRNFVFNHQLKLPWSTADLLKAVVSFKSAFN